MIYSCSIYYSQVFSNLVSENFYIRRITMSSNLKRVVFYPMMITLALLAVSCGNKATPASQAPAGGGGEIVKPEKIVVLGTVITIGDDSGGAEFRAAYEKMTGVKLEFIKPAHNQYEERVNLAFASQDLPDIFEPPGAEFYSTFAVNGALYDVTDMYYASPIVNGAETYVADTIKIKGRLYAVPSTHGNGCITYIRKDWLDKLGIPMPKTWDEYYNMLVAFRDQDPDGDGQKNTTAFIAAGVINPMYLRDFYPGNNTQPDFYEKDGKIVEGMYQPELLEGLKRLSSAYKEGLVDQESVTLTTSAARDKFYTGKVGVFTYWAGQWNQQIQDNLVRNVPTGVVEPLPPIAGSVLVDRPASWTMAIPAGNKNPQGLFKYYMEVAFDRGEGQILFSHGVEGVHWARENGVYKKLPDRVNPDRLSDHSIFTPYVTMYPWNDPFPWPELIKKSADLFNANAKPSRVLPNDESITGIVAELLTVRSEIVAKIVMGTYTPEEGIELYRRQYDKQVQECLTVMNKLF
jgi:putative aldouronate transport system substrate-binding protein